MAIHRNTYKRKAEKYNYYSLSFSGILVYDNCVHISKIYNETPSEKTEKKVEKQNPEQSTNYNVHIYLRKLDP